MRDHAQEHSYNAGPVISGRAWSVAPCAGPAAVMLSSCPRIFCTVSAGPGIAARFGRRVPAGRGHGARVPAGRQSAAVGICSGSGPAVAGPGAVDLSAVDLPAVGRPAVAGPGLVMPCAASLAASGPAGADPAALLRRSSGLPWAESARRGTGSPIPGAVCPGTGSAGAAWAAIRGGDRSGAAVLGLDRAGDLPRLPFRRGTGARIGAGKPPRAWRYRAMVFPQLYRWMQGSRALTGSKYFPAITIDPLGLTIKHQQ